jgi:hypothetical protein
VARYRVIKPEFFTSTQVVEVSHSARIAFIGLWVFADDSGIHPGDAKRLKMEVFPSDDCTLANIKQWVTELICVGLLEEYEANGHSWWQITGWNRHQKIDQPTYKYPLPDGTIPRTHQRRWDKQTTNNDGNTPYIQGENGTERNGTETNTVRSFVATDHFHVWPDARKRAAETAKRLWPSGRPQPTNEPEREKRATDNAMLLKLAFLSLSLFPDGWFADAVGGATARTQKPIKNRLAYLKTILAKTAETKGYCLNELLGSIEIPPKPYEPEKPAMEVGQIGRMPE